MVAKAQSLPPIASPQQENMLTADGAIGTPYLDRDAFRELAVEAAVFLCEETHSWVPMSSDMEKHPRYNGWLSSLTLCRPGGSHEGRTECTKRQRLTNRSSGHPRTCDGPS
jgi:hypothetical protein